MTTLPPCAPLAAPVLALLEAGCAVSCLRDLTRGGLASALVEIAETRSPFFAGMAGSRLPIAVAHGEGRAEFASAADEAAAAALVTMRFVDNHGRAATRYPANPNGSPQGIAGLASEDGLVTILMPHPERVFRTVQNSWHPAAAGEDSGWMRMFRNARTWVS